MPNEYTRVTPTCCLWYCDETLSKYAWSEMKDIIRFVEPWLPSSTMFKTRNIKIDPQTYMVFFACLYPVQIDMLG